MRHSASMSQQQWPHWSDFASADGQRSHIYKRNFHVMSQGSHNCAWQPNHHNSLCKTSNTLWIHRGVLINQWYSLTTRAETIRPTLLPDLKQQHQVSPTHVRHWACFNIKMLSYQCRDSHLGDETVGGPYYLHNGDIYTGKISMQVCPLHTHWIYLGNEVNISLLFSSAANGWLGLRLPSGISICIISNWRKDIKCCA